MCMGLFSLNWMLRSLPKLWWFLGPSSQEMDEDHLGSEDLTMDLGDEEAVGDFNKDVAAQEPRFSVVVNQAKARCSWWEWFSLCGWVNAISSTDSIWIEWFDDSLEIQWELHQDQFGNMQGWVCEVLSHIFWHILLYGYITDRERETETEWLRLDIISITVWPPSWVK